MSASILSKLPIWLLRLLRVTVWTQSTEDGRFIWRRFSPHKGEWETREMTEDEAFNASLFWASAP